MQSTWSVTWSRSKVSTFGKACLWIADQRDRDRHAVFVVRLVVAVAAVALVVLVIAVAAVALPINAFMIVTLPR